MSVYHIITNTQNHLAKVPQTHCSHAPGLCKLLFYMIVSVFQADSSVNMLKSYIDNYFCDTTFIAV